MIISTCNQYNKIIGIRAEPWEQGVHYALPALVGWEEPRFQRDVPAATVLHSTAHIFHHQREAKGGDSNL